MQKAVPVGVGKMVAVLGKEVSEIEAALAKVSKGVAQIANINSPGQVVVAGVKDAVDEMIGLLGNAKVMELSVSAPFHCSLMKPAEESLSKDLASLTIAPCKFPVYANYSGKAVFQPQQIRDALRLQVCGRVRWVECMQNAIAEISPTEATEFGMGSVLTGMLKRINPTLPRKNVSGPEVSA